MCSYPFVIVPHIIVVLGLNAIFTVWTEIGLYIQEQFQVIISQLSKKLNLLDINFRSTQIQVFTNTFNFNLQL